MVVSVLSLFLYVIVAFSGITPLLFHCCKLIISCCSQGVWILCFLFWYSRVVLVCSGVILCLVSSLVIIWLDRELIGLLELRSCFVYLSLFVCVFGVVIHK